MTNCIIHPEIELVDDWTDQTDIPCRVCPECIKEWHKRNG